MCVLFSHSNNENIFTWWLFLFSFLHAMFIWSRLEEILFPLINQPLLFFYLHCLVGFYLHLFLLFVCCAVVPLMLSGIILGSVWELRLEFLLPLIFSNKLTAPVMSVLLRNNAEIHKLRKITGLWSILRIIWLQVKQYSRRLHHSERISCFFGKYHSLYKEAVISRAMRLLQRVMNCLCVQVCVM